MASIRKVTTRSMSKDSSSSPVPFNSNSNNNNNKNINPKKIAKTGTGLQTTNSSKAKKQQEMEVEFNPTEDEGVEEITFGFSQEVPKLGGNIEEEEDEDEPMDSSSTNPPKNKGKQKEKIMLTRPPVDWQVEYGRRRYKMQVDWEKIPGSNNSTRMRIISEALASLESFISVRTSVQQGKKMITALFGAEADANKARKITLADKSTVQMEATPIFDRIGAKNKSIRAWDIPLNVSQEEVRTAFTKFGEIKSLRMQTIGMWQSANIEFLNQADYDKLAPRWSIPFRADLIRVFPFLNTREINAERSEYTLKLGNLPPGITGFDLKEIIQETRAQTCYIPRTRNYGRRRFAILSFRSNEAQEAAADTHVALGNTTLQWYHTATKLCDVCTSPDHKAKECDIRNAQVQRAQGKKENAKKFGHLYQRYNPVGTPAMKKYLQVTKKFQTKSYAEATRQPKQQNKGTPKKPIIPTSNNSQPSLADIMQAIRQLGEEIKGIKTEMTKMDTRIGYLEDDAFYHHME
jgi:hypothetical protein